MANFGGPRDSGEIVSFLCSLLGDQDVIRTPFPGWFHRGMFGLIAWYRGTFKARKEYATMGEGKGGSPIVGTTEKLAAAVRDHSGCEIVTFHRYNPRTHAAFFKKIHEMDGVGNIRICTLFPQFSYSTVGSLSRMFQVCSNIARREYVLWTLIYAEGVQAQTAFQTCSYATPRNAWTHD